MFVIKNADYGGWEELAIAMARQISYRTARTAITAWPSLSGEPGAALKPGRVAARTGTLVYDSQCGMRLLHGRALSEVRPPPGGYEAEPEHLKRCLLAGISVEWVLIPAIFDRETTDFRALGDGVRAAWTLLR